MKDEAYETDDDLDGYGVVRLRISWGGASLGLLAALVAFNTFYMHFARRMILLIGLTPLVLVAGLVLGLIGLRFDEKKDLARWSALLNGSIVGLIFLLVVVWYFVRR